MQITGDISLTGVNRLRTGRTWQSTYTRPGVTASPSLVLDFERGFYGTTQLSTATTGLLTLTRTTSKTMIGPTGAPQVFAAQTPAFDWASGQRGLHLAPTNGAIEADVAKVPLSSWWSAPQGTLVLDFRVLTLGGTFDRIAEINQAGGAANRISVLYNSALGQIVFGVYDNSNGQAVLLGPQTAYAVGTRVRLAVAYQSNRFSISVAGGPILTSTAGSVPTGLDNFWLGAANESTNKPTILMHRVQYYNLALTDPQLPVLSV